MIGVFFAKRKDQKPVSSPKILDTAGGIRESAHVQPNLEPSLRCMLIYGKTYDSVCRECLALHSTSLTVWTYHFYYISKRYSAELCVFSSQHKSTYILQKCKRTFCGGLLEWDLADCQKLDAAFPLHRVSAGIKKKSLYGKNLHKA